MADENLEQPQEPSQEPPVEEIPETNTIDAWWRSFNKFGQERVYSQDEFFDEVRSQFARVPWKERKSRAGQGAPRTPRAPSGAPIFPPMSPGRGGAREGAGRPPRTPGDLFLENVESMLMAKYRPEARESTTYRTMREAERKQGMIQEFKIKPMSKEEFLKDLQYQIESVPWKEKNTSHKATVRSRPGISREYQEALDNERYD